MENKNIVINISIIIVCIVVIYYVFNDNKPENYIDPTQLPIEAVTAMLGTLQSIVDTNGTLNMTTISTTNFTTKNIISSEPVFEIQNGTLVNNFKYVASSKDAKVIRIGDGSGLRLNFVGKTATDPSILQIYDNNNNGVVVGGNLTVNYSTPYSWLTTYPNLSSGGITLKGIANADAGINNNNMVFLGCDGTGNLAIRNGNGGVNVNAGLKCNTINTLGNIIINKSEGTGGSSAGTFPCISNVSGGSNMISVGTNALICNAIIGGGSAPDPNTGKSNPVSAGQPFSFGWQGWPTPVNMYGPLTMGKPDPTSSSASYNGLTIYSNLCQAIEGRVDANTVNFLHWNATQGIGIGYDGIYKIGSYSSTYPNISIVTGNNKNGYVNVYGGLTVVDPDGFGASINARILSKLVGLVNGTAKFNIHCLNPAQAGATELHVQDGWDGYNGAKVKAWAPNATGNNNFKLNNVTV